jgi:hypothetical protein
MSRRLKVLRQRARSDQAPGVVLIDPTEEEVRAALARGLHVVALPHNHRELKPCAQP